MTIRLEWSETPVPYLRATPEQAPFDTFYIATRKGKRFARLPEIDFNCFKQKELEKIPRLLPVPNPIRNAIMGKIELTGR